MIQQDDSQSSRPTQNPNPTYNTNPTFNPNPTQSSEQMPRPTPIQDDYDDYVITPEQSYYEIVLIRPKSIDDVNYVIDQIVEERNPVILDLSFLEKDSPANFKLAGEKIKQMRAKYGAQALLLARSEEKNLIIISPNKVRLINKS
ncbi:MAG: cell division protein SepF [Methanobrevibacter sp.]|nr:cell division protein SepF [Methanobrevibacter sp.]